MRLAAIFFFEYEAQFYFTNMRPVAILFFRINKRGGKYKHTFGKLEAVLDGIHRAVIKEALRFPVGKSEGVIGELAMLQFDPDDIANIAKHIDGILG